MTLTDSADGFCNRTWNDCDTGFFNLVSPAEFTEPYNPATVYPAKAAIGLSDVEDYSKKKGSPPGEIYSREPYRNVALDEVEVVIDVEEKTPVVILQNSVDIQFSPRTSHLPTITCRSMWFWWRATGYESLFSNQGAWGLLDEVQDVGPDDVPVFLAIAMKIKMTSDSISEGPPFMSVSVSSNAITYPW